jgi:hypothetical protein
MFQANSALSDANRALRAHHLPFRLCVGHNSRWLSVYANRPGRRVRECAVRGCSGQDDQAIEALCFQLVNEARRHPDTGLDQLLTRQSDGQESPSAHLSPRWPEICEAVVSFQRRQGVNMNLVGPFRGQGYFRLLPADCDDVSPARTPFRPERDQRRADQCISGAPTPERSRYGRCLFSCSLQRSGCG